MIMIIMLLVLKSIRNIFLAYKVVCIDDRFTKLVVIYRGRHAFNKLIEASLKENDYWKKSYKNAF